jgi:nitronate monooxygenase
MYKSAREFKEAIEETKSKTSAPFGVNINYFPSLMPADNREYIKIAIDAGVRVIETSGHKAPEKDIPLFKESGVSWIHKCAALEHAVKAEKLGADMVSVVGYENGGATGKYDIGVSVLIPKVVDSVNIPVIGGGGVADGRQFLAMLSLGASAVNMGTRFLMSKECPVHENLKLALLKADITDTILVLKSIHSTHRVWKNHPAEKIIELEAKKAKLEELLDIAAGTKAKKLLAGDLEAGIVSCGQGVGLVHEILSIQEIVDRMIFQAERTLKRFNLK